MQLVEPTRVRAAPGDVSRFFEEMEESYSRWHPDHVTFRWLDGGRLEAGAEANFEERIGGKLQQKTVRSTEVDLDRYIEFEPTSWGVALSMPHISFTIDQQPDGCEVTQRISVRTGPIGAWLNRQEVEAVRRHMREEAENLKRILEAESKVPSDA